MTGLLSISKSLTARLTWSAILIVTLAVLIAGSGLIWIAYTAEKENVYLLQEERAERIALLITGYTSGAESELRLFEEIVPLSSMTEKDRYEAVEGLLISRGALFSQITLLDPDGTESIKVSRYHTYLPDELGVQAENPAFLSAMQGSSYIGPVYLSEESSLMSVLIAVPVTSRRGEITGVLAAEVNVLPLWQEFSQIRIDDTGYTYLVDGDGRFIAYQEVSEVLRNYGADMTGFPPVAAFLSKGTDERQVYEYRGLAGEPVIGVYAPVAGTDLAVIAELPVQEAYASINRMLLYLAGLILITLPFSGLLVFIVAERIVRPIRDLTEAAERIGAGDLDAEISFTNSNDEVGMLARTFSSMQGDLKRLYRGLEDQVEALRIAHIELLQKNTELHEKEEALQETNRDLALAEEELRENYMDLDRSQKALSEARRKLSLLDTVTSQDIQNALFSLQGYLELQKGAATPEEVLKFTGRQEEIIGRIGETLEFARKYQNIGLHPPRWQSVEHTFLLGISHLDPGDLARDLRISGLEVYADPMLEEVFFTLADNTLRHGGPVQRISLWYEENLKGMTIIYEDDGDGIADEKKERIFDRHSGATQGMDLFLAREVLSITGIRIQETGEYGQGARFEILIPEKGYRVSK